MAKAARRRLPVEWEAPPRNEGELIDLAARLEDLARAQDEARETLCDDEANYAVAFEQLFAGSSAGLVGHEAQGSFGAMPARSSMIIVMKLSGSWKPRAADRIRPMAALFDSEMPFVSFHSIVASMDAR